MPNLAVDPLAAVTPQIAGDTHFIPPYTQADLPLTITLTASPKTLTARIAPAATSAGADRRVELSLWAEGADGTERTRGLIAMPARDKLSRIDVPMPFADLAPAILDRLVTRLALASIAELLRQPATPAASASPAASA